MRKIAALVLSLAVLYGVSLIPTTAPTTESKKFSFTGINSEAMSALKVEASSLNNERITNLVNNLKEKKSVVYQGHESDKPAPTPFAWIYLAGLAVGILGFSSFKKSDKTSAIMQEAINKFDQEEDVLVNESIFNSSELVKGFNYVVAANIQALQGRNKASTKTIDVDFDENLSECFIDLEHLDKAVNNFMMASYSLAQDDSTISGLYFRTAEKGQRFNLNCYIPSMDKASFAFDENSNIFVEKLAALESSLSLYYPRISFRWIATGETHGVDICLSLENKSVLENVLKESNA